MDKLKRFLHSGEKGIIMVLAVLMALVLAISTLELGVIIFKEFFDPVDNQGLFLDIGDLSSIFGFFLYILIGLELFVTVVMFLNDHVIHGEVILLVGITAVSRKIIILDYAETEPLTVIGMALLVAAMSLGYFLIKRSYQSGGKKKKQDQ